MLKKLLLSNVFKCPSHVQNTLTPTKHPPNSQNIITASTLSLKSYINPKSHLLNYLKSYKSGMSETLSMMHPGAKILFVCGAEELIKWLPASRYNGEIGMTW